MKMIKPEQILLKKDTERGVRVMLYVVQTIPMQIMMEKVCN